MRIIQLTCENFKRLSAVTIRPDGNIVEITGKNDQGKSSVLDSIWWTALGKASGKEMPIKRGAKKVGGYIDLGDLRISRTLTEKGSQVLKVTNAEGWAHPSSDTQDLLNKLFKGLTFDPEAFARMEEKKQMETLRQLSGCDTAALDAERKRIYDLRTSVNKEVKTYEGAFESIKLPPEPPAVGEEIDVADIAAKKSAAIDQKSANDNKRREAAAAEQRARDAETTVRSMDIQIGDIQERIDELKAKIESVKESQAVAAERAKDSQAAAANRAAAAAELVDPDTSNIDLEIADAKAHNAKVKGRWQAANEYKRLKETKEQRQGEFTVKKNESDRLTEKIEDIDKQRAEVVANAKFPYPGMSIHDEFGIVIDGVPLEGASSSQKLLVGLHVAAALNPDVKIICIRHGSLCDPDRLKFIDEWAAKNDYQVWIERTTGGEQIGIVIEDGMIRAETKEEAEPAATMEPATV